MTKSLLPLICLWPLLTGTGQESDELSHDTKNVQGWTVHVDRDLTNKAPELAAEALRILDHKLYGVALIVPADRVQRLRQVPIWLDLNRRRLRGMQYHPSKKWLVENGHDPRLARAVHIPQAKSFVNLARSNMQPAVVIHELAHAYHDQVLGFDNAEVKAAWDAAVAANIYEEVLHVSGRDTRHYALTDHKEYFAESTEAFFDTNDFYPFVRAELARHDKTMFELLKKIWQP